MIFSKKFTYLMYVVLLGVGVFWWLVVSDWISTPRSYKGGIFYISVVLLTLGFHLRALYRFNKMTKMLKLEERAGEAPPGSTIFAANQRFRYFMRTIESLLVLTIGAFAIWSVSDPKIQLNKNYLRLVLTYFVGSILLTGYLTVRDLLVVNRVKEMAQAEEDTAALAVPTHSKRSS